MDTFSKKKISIAINSGLLDKVEKRLQKNHQFRNRSHLFEYAAEKLLGEQES